MELLRFGPTLELAREFLPSQVGIQQLGGTIHPSGTLQGKLLDSGFAGTLRAEVLGEKIQGVFPNIGVRLLPAKLTLRIFDVPVQHSSPQSLKAELQVTGAGLDVQQYQIQPLTLQVFSEQARSGVFSGAVDLQGHVSTPELPSIGSISQPLELKVSTAGDTSSQLFDLSNMMVKVENLFRLTGQGHVGPAQGNKEFRQADMSIRFVPEVEALVSVLPQDLVGDLVIRKRGEQDVMTLKVTGGLDKAFVPQLLDVEGVLHVTTLSASSATRGLTGLFDRIDLRVDGTYSRDRGKLKGTISSDLVLSGWSQKGGLTVGTTKAHLDSRIQGVMSPKQGLTRLSSQDSLAVGMEQFQYKTSDMTALLNKVAFHSQSKEHLLAGRYHLNKLQLSAGTTLRVNAQGRFDTGTEEFVIDAKVPYLNIGQLLKQVSGKRVRSLATIQPTGRLSLAVKSHGRIPKTTGLDPLHFPATLLSHVTLKDVTGAFHGHRVVGANGSLTLSYQPTHHQLVKAVTDIRMNALAMAPGYPLSQTSDVFVNLDLAAEAFDRIRIHDVHIGFDGATMSASGMVHGVRDFLEGKPAAMATSLGPLFAQIKSQAAVDIAKLSKVLTPYGIRGSGKSEWAVTVLKKERGSFDAQIQITNRNLSLITKDTKLQNLNGSLSLRKVLQWADNQTGSTRQPAFSPTALLPKLQLPASKERRVQVERLEINGLTISNLNGGIQFDRNRLSIRNLAMDFLRGGLGGHILLTSGKRFSVITKLEGTGLDLHALLDSGPARREASLVDGIVDITAFFDEQNGRLDFGRSRLNLEFPKIGREALDRLLQFLDPTGSNPSIVGVRATLKLANPSRARLTLNKGLLGLTIKFQNRLIPDFPLPRIPIGTIKEVQTFTDSIAQWDRIRQMMQLFGATHYAVDQDGNLALE